MEDIPIGEHLEVCEMIDGDENFLENLMAHDSANVRLIARKTLRIRDRVNEGMLTPETNLKIFIVTGKQIGRAHV